MSVRIDVNKTHSSLVCIICHYWYFLEVHFRSQPKVCDGCHALMEKAMSFNDVAIEGHDSKIHFRYMNEDEANNIMENSDFL